MTYTPKLAAPYQRRGGLADNVGALGAPLAEWREGVQWTSQCEVAPGVWGCGRHAGEPKGVAAPGDTDMFGPTIFESAAQCNVAGSISLIGNRQKQIAAQGLQMSRWQLMADLLYEGFTGIGAGGQDNPNPNFFDVASVPENQNYDTPSSITATLEGLLDHECNRWSEPILHVPNQFRQFFIEQYLVEYDPSTGRYAIGDLRVSFDCYQNRGPVAADVRDAPEDGSAFWMYLSSVPQVEWDSNIQQYDYTEVQLNRYTAVAEQGGIAVFDPCSVVAALANVYPTGR